MEVIVLVWSKLFGVLRDNFVYTGYPSWLTISVIGSLLCLAIKMILSRNIDVNDGHVFQRSSFGDGIDN